MKKRLQKLFAVLLTLSMVMSLMSVTAFANEDLGAEAIRRLEVENFPVIVVIDSEGNNLYETGREAYLNQMK